MRSGTARVDILGVPFNRLSAAETVDAVRDAVTTRRRTQIVPANVDFIVKATRDPDFASVLERADLVVPDGVPVVWAGALLGTPLVERVSGTDLIESCASLSAELNIVVAFVGSEFTVTSRAATALESKFPGAQIRAVETPYPLDKAASTSVVQAIKEHSAKIVCVALGAPRQERWIAEYLASTEAYVGIGCGSALDILSGDRPRAPRWMRDNGFEWFYRLLHEPRRLGRRYLLEDSVFLWYLLRELVSTRLNPWSRT